jgi:hypothetical protein
MCNESIWLCHCCEENVLHVHYTLFIIHAESKTKGTSVISLITR